MTDGYAMWIAATWVTAIMILFEMLVIVTAFDIVHRAYCWYRRKVALRRVVADIDFQEDPAE